MLTSKFFIRIFLFAILACLLLKIIGSSVISDELTLGLMAYVSVLIGLNNVDKKNQRGGDL